MNKDFQNKKSEEDGMVVFLIFEILLWVWPYPGSRDCFCIKLHCDGTDLIGWPVEKLRGTLMTLGKVK